jgi:hypothetical protein
MEARLEWHLFCENFAARIKCGGNTTAGTTVDSRTVGTGPCSMCPNDSSSVRQILRKNPILPTLGASVTLRRWQGGSQTLA